MTGNGRWISSNSELVDDRVVIVANNHEYMIRIRGNEVREPLWDLPAVAMALTCDDH